MAEKITKAKDGFECYFDGLSPEFKKQQAQMTAEEREESLRQEQEKCLKMGEW